MAISTHSFLDELCKIAGAKKDPIGEEEVKKIKRELELWTKLRGKSPVKIKIDKAVADMHGGGYFDQQAKIIGLSQKDYETLAHELGHAELDKRLLGRVIQHPIARASYRYTPLAAAFGGMLAGAGKKMGLLLPVLTAAPTLLSERMATSRGSKKLKDVGASKEEIKRFKKRLGEGFASYLPDTMEGAVAGATGFMLAKHLLKASSP